MLVANSKTSLNNFQLLMPGFDTVLNRTASARKLAGEDIQIPHRDHSYWSAQVQIRLSNDPKMLALVKMILISKRLRNKAVSALRGSKHQRAFPAAEILMFPKMGQ